MKRAFCWMLILGLVISLGMLGCAKKDKEIKVGVVAPLTGPAAPYGENIRDGAVLAIEEINASGGINGCPMVLVFEDEGATPQQAVAAVNKLITVDRVPVIIGPSSSNGILAAAPVAERNRVVLISPGAASDNVRNAGDYIFRNRASAYQEAAALAKYALEDMALEKFAILRTGADFGLSFAKVFREIISSEGGQILTEEAYHEGDVDFRTQLVKIKATKPDGVFFVGAPIELGNILKQNQQLGTRLTIFSNSIESPEVFKIAGEAAEGVIFSTTFYDPEHGDEKLQRFDRRYKERYGKLSDLFAANGYDAVYVVRQAIVDGGYDADKIKDAFYSLKDFRGLMGSIAFDEKGDVTALIAIKKIVGRKFQFIKVVQK
ncbi:MAG: penicillin-binding protein activator [Desulfobacterales bacterium]|nr:penicillin-binding protein activator [Desulfobacterales bacterium]